MGPTRNGQFTVPRPATALGFTGERMTSDIGGQIAFEHYHRYCLARDLVAGRDVLDVASGEGYGSALLAGAARSVVGVEIDAASVRHAQAAYALPNLRFLQGDATRMPLPDACVDAVVSFETLEHLQDQEAFFDEIRRVLRPGGLLLISTPDRHVYSAPGQPANRYHVLELTVPEFTEILGRRFAHHGILAQRAVMGSVLAPLDGAWGGWRTYDSRNGDLIEAQPGLSRAFYLVAVASDAPLPAVGSSLFAHNVSLDHLLAAPGALATAQRARADMEAAWQEAERRETLARQMVEEQRTLVEEQRARSEAALAEARREAAESLARSEAMTAETRREAAELMAHIERIRTSTLWRAMGPLRVLGRRFPGLARFGGRAIRVAHWTVTGQLTRRLRDRRAALEARAAVAGEDLRAALSLPAEPEPVPQPAEIHLPRLDGPPRVSVIIPTYGQVDFTLRCLRSITAAAPAVPVEVIVVDDASGDPAVETLAQVEGLRLLRWPSNLGFLRSCNEAAKQARGEFLFFLNNDTELLPGAIEALLRLLEARPDAGMVGSKLVYPDGRLQEAGGIIWRDGSAWNYGNGDDPRKPQYNYVREADYISGAAIMLPRVRWAEMGGFDEAFLPAYCEDSDLAFRLRRAGWKVLYQPQSVVVHYEGISHGTDTQSGVKAHQVANTRKLFERWREVLEREALPHGERVMRARDHALHRRVMLVVDHYLPEPDRDAGSRTMLAFMDALLAAGRVVKFLPANLHRTPGYAELLEQRGIEVIHGPWTASLDAWLAANGGEVDEILLSRPSVAVPILGKLRAHCRAPIVFYGHDLHFARMMLEPGADAPAQRDRIAEMEAQERRIWRLVDVALYPSEEEAARVRAMEPGVRAHAVPAYALPRRPAPATAPAGGIVFVGGFRHTPNEDAALWLTREIMPLVRQRLPAARLTIIGSNPTPAVLGLAGDGVEVRGFVSDEELAAAYAEARVALCPLRIGAGVKLKVVEAMHRGVPVVTTPVGAQGLPGLAEICDIAGTPEELAAAAVRLMTDDALWLSRAAAQTGYVADHFSPEAMRDALVAIFEEARAARE
ncbi:glycosyltransferase [Belnapia sp. T6]|uniref:Glycosyltransferase n=1 Tax=Belnapia mucosa TaxID=2804532 RepID=A0ABS1V7I0_9PROT|nr:glycosyltransferase [Belnapia mucosa]MBL6457600.1 glycosyltransferase [Belnapia mucosa]